jgi:EAL domain-containing protein (putative c-di-GMP-specific phosphodiesterase class I)
VFGFCGGAIMKRSMRVFEPIFDLRDKRMLGYEVLYRGVEDREGFFEGCTEREDLEIFLGHVEDIRRVKRDGELYFVNVFGSTVLAYWEVIEKECRDLKDCLVLEISEKRRISSRGIKEVLGRLCFMSCLDDFGSGWSSVELMLKLRPPFVKLDIKHFYEVLPWMVKLIKSLQLRSIIERVETGKELMLVRKNDVCLIQGRILENGWDRK